MEQIERYLKDLALLPGLSGHEQPVAAYMKEHFCSCGLQVQIDTLGNCIATQPGTDPDAPRVMVFAHMDSLGFIVRYIEKDGFIRIERLGGIPEKVLPSTEIQIQTRSGKMVPGVIGVKAHHVTPPEEKYVVDKYTKLFVDIGASSREEVLSLGIDVGSPIVYKPKFQRMLGHRAYMSAADNRGGCTVLLELAHTLTEHPRPSTVWLVGTVLEEYNLRGAMVASRTVKPDVAISLDSGGGADTPDLVGTGSTGMGKGPVMTLYNFHGRGTLNGTIAHPAMVRLVEAAAKRTGLPLQRNAYLGVLTDLAYVQLEGTGVKCVDLGFPCRYTHSPCEAVDMKDLEQLSILVKDLVDHIDANTDFSR